MSYKRYGGSYGSSSNSGRKYTNPYTILEKVKKGEIQSRYSSQDGYRSSYYGSSQRSLFGKLDFYKKPDLINPHLHWLDDDKLKEMMRTYVMESTEGVTKLKNIYEKGMPNTPDGKKVDFTKFYDRVKELYTSFPKHMLSDVFKMYYHKMGKLDFEERTSQNFTKYKFLERSNNPIGKIMTERSSLKSAIFSRNTIFYFLYQLAKLEIEDPEAAKKLQSSLAGNGSDFDQQEIQDYLDGMMNSSKKDFDREMTEAMNICKILDDNIDSETQQVMYDSSLDRSEKSMSPGKMDVDFIRKIVSSLEDINLSMNSLKNTLKKMLDKTINYFSLKKIPIYEDLFNADDISGLDEYELLHPKLRKIFAEDVQVKDTKSIGKLNVYIDISGSMTSSCGAVNTKGRKISRIDFAKSLTAKLKSLDLLEDVYLFDNKVHNYKNDLISISTISANGGTSIDAAVNHIIRNNKNSIIITDAEDSCSIYTDKVLFIGLEGARFTGFRQIKEYSDREQVIIFDGKTINRVDEKGHIIY